MAEYQHLLAQLEADPYNPELQSKVEEAINGRNIDESLMKAQESNPIAFSRVTMLYLNAHIDLPGIPSAPITLFVDSGAQFCVMSEQYGAELPDAGAHG